MTKIFVTGVTGYIGGDAFYTIANAHPEYEFTCLVRSSDKGAQVAQVYPKVKLVYGNLDSVDLIEEESKKADIVLDCASADATKAAEAIIRGLSAHEDSRPGFYIHCGGAGIILIDDITTGTYGEELEKVYDDLEGVSEVTSLPDEAPHRPTDRAILAAWDNTGGKVKTAIVNPPTIYATGRGPGNQRSHQLPELARVALEKGYGVKVGQGKDIWSNVHVHDLSNLFLALVENAAAGGSKAEWPDKPALWGPEGYFFAENGEHVWGDLSQLVATEAQKQGLIKTNEIKSVSAEEADGLTPWGGPLWGANARARAKRARKALKWKPTGVSIQDTVKEAVEYEAKKLGLKPGHAKVAAGDA